MSDYQEFTGKTVEEALKSAREALGVSDLRELDFEILTQGSRGVLGMGAEPARIIAAARSGIGAAAPRQARSEAAPPAAAPTASIAGEPLTGSLGAEAPAPEAAAPEDAGSPPEAAAPAGAAPPPAAPPREPRPASSTPGRPRGSRRGRGGVSEEAQRTSPSEAQEVAAERARVDKDDIQAAEASPEALRVGQEILERVVELMGYRATVSVTTEPTARVTVLGADDEEREALGALIGRKGERLSALQHLVNLMLSRRMGEWTRVLVDVEDYRGRRERQLAEVARRAADRVLETGTMLQLEPMSALERRWIHIALRDVEGVATQSIGEEPQRRVVVLKT